MGGTVTLRKILFWCHLSLGVAAGLLILNASVTGMLLAFEHQIVDWAERGVRRAAPPAAEAPRLGLDALSAALLKEIPGARVSSLTVSSEPESSVSFYLGKEAGTVYVDPFSGRVLGKGSQVHDALHAVEDWHRWLWSREPGKVITGAACFAFFFMLLSGLYLWWPAKTARPRAGLSGKARDWNWHNAAGFWAAPFILVTTLTGLVMSYGWANDLLYRMMGTEPPPRAVRQPPAKGPGPSVVVEPLFLAARAKAGAWETISIRLPMKDGDPASATITEPSAVGPDRRSQLTLNAATAEPVKWEPYADQSPGRKVRAWMKPIHTGEAFGWAGQVAAFLTAAAAALLVWTGLSLAWRRFLARGSSTA